MKKAYIEPLAEELKFTTEYLMQDMSLPLDENESEEDTDNTQQYDFWSCENWDDTED